MHWDEPLTKQPQARILQPQNKHFNQSKINAASQNEGSKKSPQNMFGCNFVFQATKFTVQMSWFFAIKLGLCSLRKLAAIGLHFARDMNLNDDACHNVILWGLRSQKCLRFTAFLKARQHDTRRSAVYYQVNKKLAVLNRITSTKSKHVL